MQEPEMGARLLPASRSVSAGRGPRYRKVKRLMDVGLAAGFLVLLAPLLGLIALLVKLDSAGPILYRQERVGRDGRIFPMLKFRSMRAGSDSGMHREYVQRVIREKIRPEDVGLTSLKLDGDPRITRVGKTLRALSLDELPQLVNVLRGEMSLVGPRPSLPYEYELYEDWHKQRLAVLPGITGLWQVTARNQVSFEEMVRIDHDYITAMSPWLDVQILARTPLTMLRGKGAG